MSEMRLRRALVMSSFGITSSLVVGTAILFACSSSNDVSIDNPPADSSTDTYKGSKESSPDEEASVDAAPVCAPQALTTTPTWHPPKPIDNLACTSKEATDFVNACVTGTRATCDGFVMQHAKCAACAYSSSKDATWGPLVSYRDKAYAHVNFGGCVAMSVGETDGTHCGGAYQLYDQCALEACSGCLPITTKNTVAKLDTCEADPQVKQICATWIAQSKTECASVSANGPAKRCALGTSTFQENALRYVSFWCGPLDDPDAGDAGDAGDASDQ